MGLSASLFLSWRGVDSVLAERHPGTSIHPRAWGLYPRTLELLRAVGAERAVMAESAGFAGHVLNGRVESLAGPEISVSRIPEPEDVSGVSPVERIVSLSQDRVEPILLERARTLGSDVRFGTEAVDLVQDADGVTATLRDRDTGREHAVRADYVIAADGAHSPVREGLGIRRRGRGVLRHQMSVLFDADLSGPLRGRRFAICQVRNAEVEGILGHDDSLRRGTLIVTYRPEEGERPEDFTEERCVRLVRAAIGSDGVEVGLRDVMPWEMAALTAERLSEGRVFLAGDSAHVIPPVGGYGANTGVQDAYDLAWKLQAVLGGTAPPALLDTYDEERRPVAEATVRQAAMRLAARSGVRGPDGVPGLADPLAVTFGYRYRSSAVADGLAGAEAPGSPREGGAGTGGTGAGSADGAGSRDAGAGGAGGGAPRPDGAPGTEFTHPSLLSGRPGTRAPHVWLRRGGRGVSSIDLFGPRAVLLAGAEGGAWADDARETAERLGVPLDVHVVGRDLAETGTDLAAALGVTARGAVLVRPDGFVAHRWRDGESSEAAVAAALARMLRRTPAPVPVPADL